MEKILQEILLKINFLLSNTYVNETDTLIDLYNEKVDKQVLQIEAIDITEPNAIESMKEFAFKQGFKIEGNYILVESNNVIYRIRKELWIK